MADATSTPSVTSQWDLFDALGDGIYGVDPDGLCTFVNKAALRMLGYAAATDLLGRNMHATIHHTRPDGSPFPQAQCPLLHTTRSGHPVRLQNEMLWRKDGSPFFAEYSSFPVFTNGTVTGSVITFSDTSMRQDAQKRLAVQYAVSQILAGTAAEDDVPALLLEAIGVGLAWDVGLFWRCEETSPDRDIMLCTAEWRSREAGPAAMFGLGSRGTQLELAAGLPGRVWIMESAIHVADLSEDMPSPKQAEAARRGLHSAFAFPVMDGSTVVGAIEFYARQRIEVDEALLEAVSTLGHQIGQTLERRRTAAALGESERLKDAILASSPDSVISIDAAGTIVEFNATAELAFGRKAADAIGKNMAETIFPADAHAAHRRAFARALEGDEAVLGRRIEVDAVRADGSLFPVEFAMTRTAWGMRPLFTTYLRDITARRRERARLWESEERFRTIANAIPQLAWMTDASGSVVWYNQRWYDFTGLNFEDMAGWGWRSVHHPNHIERVVERLREAFASGMDWEDSFPLRAADGNYHWFLSRALPIRDEPTDGASEGRVIGWFGTNTDITQMREQSQALELARDEAEAANQAKSTFIANMSHELRTPLSAIIGYAEMLAEETGDGIDPEELARDIGKIEGNARHLLGLINDVLDLSKVESGKMEAFLETFDVVAMAKEVANTVGGLVAKKENSLDLRFAENLGMMHSDITRVRQVLLNLLSNAAKFTEAGTITLSIERLLRADAEWLSFTVADTGIGMTPDQLEKLFQRFQQADASTTRQFGGTGLGLALTKAFVAMLGGRVDVASEAGSGSSFTVTLPANTPGAAPASSPEDGQADDARDVILVVDDDQSHLDLMARFLFKEGFAARTALDGPTALRLARRLAPRAILLDVTMPGMDGWSVLSALKSDPDLSGIPVVMVTFLAERALASSLGAADYVFKPVDWNRLRLVMERFKETESKVLVIEDEDDARRLARQALEKAGWFVTEACNGREALDCVAREVPDAILLDLDMPIMNGFDFLRELRDRPGCGTVPVVVLTAMDLTADARRRLRGANQVLHKGDVSLREVAEKLRELCV